MKSNILQIFHQNKIPKTSENDSSAVAIKSVMQITDHIMVGIIPLTKENNMKLANLLKETAFLNYNNPIIQKLIADRNWQKMDEKGNVELIE